MSGRESPAPSVRGNVLRDEPSQVATEKHLPKLVIVGGDGKRRELELTTGDLRIGRAPENDLALPDPTKGVSRMHAELRYESGRYVVIDLNSQNGTWLDGNRVQRADVASGAGIAIGPYRLTLVGVDASPAMADSSEDGARRVGEKTRVAGGKSFERARQFDAVGRSADAIKEYVNAAEWLPEADPNRAVARQRVDQLKAGLK